MADVYLSIGPTPDKKEESDGIDFQSDGVDFQPDKPPTNDPNIISKIWSKLSTSITDAPSRAARYLVQNQPNADLINQQLNDMLPGLGTAKSEVQGFGEGVTQGVGDFLTSMTSPLNAGLTALGAGEGMAAKSGMNGLAQLLNYGTKALSLPVIAHGATELRQHPFQGMMEMAGGATGMIHSPIGNHENINPNLSTVAEQVPEQAPIEQVPELAPPPQTSIVDSTVKLKPKFRTNGDGTFTNVTTGERFDSKGNLVDEATNAPAPMPKLPKDLAGAKPTFYYGTDKYEPIFQNDLDKSLYIIAQKNKSRRDADYLAFVMKHTGLNEVQARSLAATFKEHIKAYLKSQKPGPVEIPSVWKPKDVVSSSPNISPRTSGPDRMREIQSTPEHQQLPLEQQTGALRNQLNDEGYDVGRVEKGSPTEPPEPPEPPDTTNEDLPEPIKKKYNSKIVDALNFPKAIRASWDVSAPFRQGMFLVSRPEFWKSLGLMFRSLVSENSYKTIMQDIAEKPLFQPTVLENGKLGPSFAQKAGLKLTGLGDVNTREEAFMSHLAEKFPGVKPSERAYVSFLNKLRADLFESMIADSGGKNNDLMAKAVADYVNTASGRGKLYQGRFGDLEKSAVELNNVFFSPRLIASRIKLMNIASPQHYLYANPYLRKQFIRDFMTGVVPFVGSTIALAKLGGAEVSTNPTSPDFLKAKFGNTRIDMSGGFQPYFVALARLATHTSTSSVTHKSHDIMNPKFGQSGMADVFTRFGRSKLSPGMGTVVDQITGSDFVDNPVQTGGQRLADVGQNFIPMIMQDMYEVMKDNPAHMPAVIAGMVGGSVQTYKPKH